MNTIITSSKFVLFLILFAVISCTSSPQLYSIQAQGTVPNDLVLRYIDAKPTAFYVSAKPAQLEKVTLPQGPTQVIAQLPSDSGPTGLSLNAQATRAAVALFANNKVALVDVVHGSILSEKKIDNTSSTPVLHPQYVTYVDDRFLVVSFTNLIQAAQKPGETAIYGPGVVALLDTAQDQLRYVAQLVLPKLNPVFFSHDEQNNIWVSCDGVYQWAQQQAWNTVSDSALIKLQISTSGTPSIAIAQEIALADFAPAKPSFVNHHIVIPGTTRARVLLLPISAKSSTDGQIIWLNDNHNLTETQFSSAPLNSTLVVVTQFSVNRLAVIDTSNGALNPAPYTNGLALSQNPNAPTGGAVAVAVLPGQGKSWVATTMSLSSQLISFLFGS